MVRHMPLVHVAHQTLISEILPAIGLFVSVSVLVSLCAKHARKFSKKHTSTASEPNGAWPKKLITTFSKKAMMYLVHGKESGQRELDGGDENGLWQKAILMGDRCQPPEFSGVIYYDYSGNRINEMPKSPRPSSIIPSKDFSFPVEKYDNY